MGKYRCNHCKLEIESDKDLSKERCCKCYHGFFSALTNETDGVAKLQCSDGLCWLAPHEVTKEGWYWIDDKGSKRIIYIRKYRQKMCCENWGISEEWKYYGPIGEPA